MSSSFATTQSQQPKTEEITAHLQMRVFPMTCLGAITTAFCKAEARMAFYSTKACSRTSAATISNNGMLAFAVRSPPSTLRATLASARIPCTGMPATAVGPAGTIWASDMLHAGPVSHAFRLGRSDGGNTKTTVGLGLSADTSEVDVGPTPRIAIIGGGIAGVTAARSIANELATNKKSKVKKADIVIYEGDTNGGPQKESFDIQRQAQPNWTAATAKNANSLVPGVAMHVMSQRSTLWEIAEDTINEWLMLKVESLKGLISESLVPTKKIDNFDVVPPYFAFHPLKCLGPTATMEERLTFLTFLRHFVVTSMLSGEKEAHDRGLYVFQLAKANRVALLSDVKDPVCDGDNMNLEEKIGLGTGFMSLHRTKAKAENAVKEALEHGEMAEALTWEEATQLEPRIKNLPISPLYAAHRPNDNTANCATYVRELIRQCEDMGVKYMRDDGSKIANVERLPSSSSSDSASKRRFRVVKADGTTNDYDAVVLAAGIRTPLLARRLGIGSYCPTYPLRGFSLTLYTDAKTEDETKSLEAEGKSTNLLNRPISIDAMYCSSVGPNMARIAGFGELVGYGDKVKDVPSVGPRVMARYTRALFPDANIPDDQAIQCFRPLSPDDLPLVGEIESVPGLFLHTGHGTLGWSMAIATGQCLAQAVRDRVNNLTAESTFVLQDGSVMDRAVLSPNRFVGSVFGTMSGGHIGEDETAHTHTTTTTMAEAASPK